MSRYLIWEWADALCAAWDTTTDPPTFVPVVNLPLPGDTVRPCRPPMMFRDGD